MRIFLLIGSIIILDRSDMQEVITIREETTIIVASDIIPACIVIVISAIFKIKEGEIGSIERLNTDIKSGSVEYMNGIMNVNITAKAVASGVLTPIANR